MVATTRAFNDRLAGARRNLAEKGLDALLLTSRENNRYFCGFTGTESYLVITRDQAALLVDFRYLEQAAGECPGCEIIDCTLDRLGTLAASLSRHGVRRVGVEEEQITWKMVQDLQKCVSAIELQPAESWIFDLRAIKDAEETATIRQAIQIAEQSFLELLPSICPGQTEAEIAARLEHAMRLRGASGPSFTTIIASGPRSAMPHGVASDRAVQANEPIVMDFGCFWHGYCSDMTRTVFLGEPPAFFKTIYGIVLEAQLKGEQAVRAGVTGQEADQAARAIIVAAGYGHAYGHGLGHGVGLAIHESPRLSRTFTASLRAGEIVSVEPGIYLNGQFGVRIEDLVLVEDSGACNLNSVTKELIVLEVK